ncbi:unnamed protein product [Paramecium sonneborni]|uniref:Uncharacterized protein n=1 Tax=Paramecium sonneborni TaxID=65129 RepID=A0A8S1K5K2_9CILI|nr:unnamed protein product [Paramecium sonneborni]
MKQQMEQNIIQSTTVKTIKELKKQQEFRTSIEGDEFEQNESTQSEKRTPDAETSKTQYTKFRLAHKGSINQILPKLSNSNLQESTKSLQKQMTEELPNKQFGQRKRFNRYATQKVQQQPLQLTEQIDQSTAMNLILNKSKVLTDYYTNNQLTSTQIHLFLTDNKYFVFTFMAFLNRLAEKGILSVSLTNIQKAILSQIEQFTINQINRELTKLELNKKLKDQMKKIEIKQNQYTKFLLELESSLKFF